MRKISGTRLCESGLHDAVIGTILGRPMPVRYQLDRIAVLLKDDVEVNLGLPQVLVEKFHTLFVITAEPGRIPSGSIIRGTRIYWRDGTFDEVLGTSAPYMSGDVLTINWEISGRKG